MWADVSQHATLHVGYIARLAEELWERQTCDRVHESKPEPVFEALRDEHRGPGQGEEVPLEVGRQLPVRRLDFVDGDGVQLRAHSGEIAKIDVLRGNRSGAA
jgi:hypothetical protein